AVLSARRPLPSILVAWSPGWHRGVVGVAAGRIARDLGRPTLLLGADSSLEDGGEMLTGSGRSIPGIELHSFLARWGSRMERFGGHAQAVGLTVARERAEELRREWEAAAGEWPLSPRRAGPARAARPGQPPTAAPHRPAAARRRAAPVRQRPPGGARAGRGRRSRRAGRLAVAGPRQRLRRPLRGRRLPREGRLHGR